MDDQEDASKQGEIIANIDANKDVTLKDVAVVAKEVQVEKNVEVEKDADVQGRLEESQAKVYHIDLEHADKVLITAVTTPITVATIIAAPSAARRRKGVVIRDPEETATSSTIIHSEPKSKDKGKGIMVQKPKPLKKQAQIEPDEAYARELEAELTKNINWDDVIEQVQRKEKEDNVVLRYQALKRKPQTEAQARKNMMIYLKNMAGFKMDYFKGMSYDAIRPIFKKYFNSNVAFLEKTKEQLEEEESGALKRTSESLEEKAAKKQKLDEEVEELKKHLQIVPNNDDDVYTEATPLALKPDVEAQVWKNQRGIHSLAKVKSWRLLESYGVHIITFTTTQMILLVEKRYPLTRFTFKQILNNVRLEVKEADEEPTNYAIMAFTSSSSSSSDNESQFDVLSYKTGLEYVEARLVVYQQIENAFKEDITLLKLDVMLRDNALVEIRKKFEKAEQERDDVVFDCDELISFESDVIMPTSPMHDMYKSGEGYHVVPPLYSNRPSAPIIEDWVSDSEDKYEGEPMPTQKAPSFVQTSKHVKTPRPSVKPIEHPTPAANIRKDIPKSRGNISYLSVVPTTVLTRSRLVPLTTARPVNTVVPQTTVQHQRLTKHGVNKAHSPIRRVSKEIRSLDSGCSRHMTWNISYLSDFEEFNGGYVAFGGNPKGSKITGKDV
uniref:Uncharacterized protein n=1 Tax=Tanacetum cinerariifolium TaxID=118510 RepID=A0A699IB13_TANCI|nr:hypothetical protein [Tanacetum cinerariifolium]